MNIIWDVFVKAVKEGIPLEEIIVVPAKEYSPYYELALEHLNEKKIYSGEQFEINPIFRYPEIFNTLHPVEEEDEKRNVFFHDVFHMMYQVERELNDSKETFEVCLLKKDIENECFGRRIKDCFQVFEEEEQEGICQMLLTLYREGQSTYLIGKAIKVLYPFAYVYQLKEEKRILLYPGVPKSLQQEQKLYFFQNFFLPFAYELEIYWNYHFGIIEIDDTLELDSLELC